MSHYSPEEVDAQLQDLWGMFYRLSSGGSSFLSGFLVNVVDVFHVDNTGATDAGPLLSVAFAAIAARGQGAYLPEGTYKIATTVRLVSNLFVFCSPKAVLSSVLAGGTGNPNNAIFDYPQTTGAATTLTGNSVYGSPVIALTAIPAGAVVGAFLELTSAANPFLLAGPYKIDKIVGLNVTLDRPVLQAFITGDAVTVITPCQHVALYGNGAKLTGTGDRYIEIFTGYNCYVENFVIDGSAGMVTDTALSFDNPNYACLADRIQVDGNGTLPSALRFECGEASIFRDCIVTNTGGAGLLIGLSVGCRMENCHASGCAASGFNFQTGPSSATIVTGGSSIGNGIGILFADAVVDCQIIGVTCSGNTGDGVRLSGGPGTPTGNALVGCTITKNGANGIDNVNGLHLNVTNCDLGGNVGASVFCDTTSKDTTLDSCDISGAIGWQLRSTAMASDLTGVCSSTTLLLDNAASSLRLSGAIFRPTAATYCINLSGAGATLDAVNVDLVLPVNGTALLCNGAAAIARIDNFTAGGGAGRFGLFPNAAGSQIQCGPNVDVTGCLNAPIEGGGAGTVTLTQGGGNFADATVTGTVTLSQTQAQSTTVRPAGALTGAVRYDAPANVPGLRYVFANATSNLFAASIGVTGGAAIAVAQGSSAIVWSDGTNMHRATIDSVGT